MCIVYGSKLTIRMALIWFLKSRKVVNTKITCMSSLNSCSSSLVISVSPSTNYNNQISKAGQSCILDHLVIVQTDIKTGGGRHILGILIFIVVFSLFSHQQLHLPKERFSRRLHLPIVHQGHFLLFLVCQSTFLIRWVFGRGEDNLDGRYNARFIPG